MSDEAANTLIRIEASLGRIEGFMAVAEGQPEKLDEIESLLEKLLEQAKQQTVLLAKLWKNDRTRD